VLSVTVTPPLRPLNAITAEYASPGVRNSGRLGASVIWCVAMVCPCQVAFVSKPLSVRPELPVFVSVTCSPLSPAKVLQSAAVLGSNVPSLS
jgi:hypothetical protein